MQLTTCECGRPVAAGLSRTVSRARSSFFTITGSLGLILFSFGFAAAQDVHQAAPEQATPDGTEAICAPIPGQPELSESLANANRFAIPLSENLNHFQDLIGRRSEHFFSVAPALSLNGESLQRFDFEMVAYTAPAKVHASRITDVLGELREATKIQGNSEFGLTWLWERIHETHPIGELNLDWACLRSSSNLGQHLVVLLGYGRDACGTLERADNFEEARSMAKSLGLTQLNLEKIEGVRATIRGTTLHAPLYSIRDIAYHD